MSMLSSISLIELINRLKTNKIDFVAISATILYPIVLIAQFLYTISLITGDGSGYLATDSPDINNELINSSIYIRSLDSDKALYAEDPTIIYFSRRILGINSNLGQPPDDAFNIYFAYDERFSEYNTNNNKLEYYVKNNNYSMLKNFGGVVYLFEH